MNKKHTFEIHKNGDFSVWHIPQVPMKPFRVSVSGLHEAALIIDTLAAYDAFQFKHNIKPDYANASDVDVFEDGEWSSWYDENGMSFDEWREENNVKQLVDFNQ